MNKEYTILIPQMAPIHFELIEAAAKASGYRVELLKECTNNTVENPQFVFHFSIENE